MLGSGRISVPIVNLLQDCLIIAGIKNHSAAYRGGLKKGDIIISVTNFLDSGRNIDLNLNDDENFDQECTKAIDILITIKPPTLDQADVTSFMRMFFMQHLLSITFLGRNGITTIITIITSSMLPSTTSSMVSLRFFLVN